jgi:hypothetical protein
LFVKGAAVYLRDSSKQENNAMLVPGVFQTCGWGRCRTLLLMGSSRQLVEGLGCLGNTAGVVMSAIMDDAIIAVAAPAHFAGSGLCSQACHLPGSVTPMQFWCDLVLSTQHLASLLQLCLTCHDGHSNVAGNRSQVLAGVASA